MFLLLAKACLGVTLFRIVETLSISEPNARIPKQGEPKVKTESKSGEPGGADKQAVNCGQCGAQWTLGERMLIGEVIECRECPATLEVAGLAPIELVPFRKIEETEEDFVGFNLL